MREARPSAESQAPAGGLRRWRFGAAALDERSLELSVNGETVAVERKPLEVLLCLLAHAGEVVTKDELLETVWPGRILTETALTKCVMKLREALNDDAQAIIKTHHGYGYRLIAPVQVEASRSPPPPRFDFKPGDHPAGRPQWRLVERLGQGGHGETWLARHDKTGDTRVYKFALDGQAVGGLKREITLYRLLRESLGDRPDLVQIHDWNLEEPPYYLESEYGGTDLQSWAERQGGFGKIGLPRRLELAAKIADALAAAHSVGVLHKDLKPGNVLASGDGSAVRLCDFGSGGVLEPGRLDALNITRLGFTRALPEDSTSGTLTYLAPEILAGQPATVQADVYALGVILFQLVVGDFRRPLAPGWERDVADDLLRDDIAAAADGNPALRLPDASLLASRLRTLESRRREQVEQRAAREQVLRERQALERMRARRRWMIATVAMLLLGTIVSTALFLESRSARARAEDAAATARAVTEFLSDVFAVVDPNERSTENLTAVAVLDHAAAQVDEKFHDRPDVAGAVHYALGNAYWGLSLNRQRLEQMGRAAALLDRAHGPDAEATLDARKWHGLALKHAGQLLQARALERDVLERLRRTVGERHPKFLDAYAVVTYLDYLLGDWQGAIAALRRGMEVQLATGAPIDDTRSVQDAVARVLTDIADYAEAERLLRELLVSFDRTPSADYSLEVNARAQLAYVLLEQGRYREALEEIETLRGERERLGFPAFDEDLGVSLAELLARSAGPVPPAQIDELRQVFARIEARLGPDTAYLYHSTPYAHLPEAYLQAGRSAEAVAACRNLIERQRRLYGPDFGAHPDSVRWLALLADGLRGEGKAVEAQAALDGIRPEALKRLPQRHPHLGELLRVQGLLWVQAGEMQKGRPALQQALEIQVFRRGATHWRAQRAQRELARLPAS